MTGDDDLRAIEALNQHDVDAVLAGDTRAIASQWTDDFVVLSARMTIRGKAANLALIEASAAQMQAFEPVDYTVEFEEITVTGEYAYEWGTYRGSVRPRAGGEATPYQGKLLRILRRQPDGSWKMHRTMMTTDPD
jgi:ketosteroid isomerase-like protein